MDTRIEIGAVARAHGLRGEVRVRLHAPESRVLLDVSEAWVGGVQRRILGARAVPGAVLLALEGVVDRTAAEALRGAPVEVPRAAIALAEGEYLLSDLPGCSVVDAGGRDLGRVTEVLHAAQPIIVIHGEGTEILLPAVPAFVLAVDAAARRVTVEVPEDLPVEAV